MKGWGLITTSKNGVYVYTGGKTKMKLRVERELLCKFCASPTIVKNESFHGVQRWLCRKCGRLFVDNEALPRMKTPTSEISLALHSYFTATSQALP